MLGGVAVALSLLPLHDVQTYFIYAYHKSKEGSEAPKEFVNGFLNNWRQFTRRCFLRVIALCCIVGTVLTLQLSC